MFFLRWFVQASEPSSTRFNGRSIWAFLLWYFEGGTTKQSAQFLLWNCISAFLLHGLATCTELLVKYKHVSPLAADQKLQTCLRWGFPATTGMPWHNLTKALEVPILINPLTFKKRLKLCLLQRWSLWLSGAAKWEVFQTSRQLR